ncbi:hypothetical protein SEUCBS139899_002979 [Sporothrix eucalyptigena]|uniref:Uncharacterized protein n=1 Tax=Sporothrix eucalyptigena TaxID=1812306 RepID=A0ABP0CA49_9PEZI
MPEKIGIILTDESATRMPGPAITVEEFLNEEGAGTNAFIIVEDLNVDTIVKLQKCPDVGMAYYMSAMLRKFPDPGDPVAPL